MIFDGNEYFVDYYSEMPIVWQIPTSQCNSANMITVLKEHFAKHGILEVIRQQTPVHKSLLC